MGIISREGLTFTSDVKCYCGNPGPDATFENAPRTDNNRFIVHAMNGDTPLYRRIIDHTLVAPESECPEGTEVDPAKNNVMLKHCAPKPLALENYNKDCSCKLVGRGSHKRHLV